MASEPQLMPADLMGESEAALQCAYPPSRIACSSSSRRVSQTASQRFIGQSSRRPGEALRSEVRSLVNSLTYTADETDTWRNSRMIAADSRNAHPRRNV